MLCGISKWTFDISHKVLNPHTATYTFAEYYFLSGIYDIFNCDVIRLSEMVPCASGSHLWQLQALTGGSRNWREGEFFGIGNFFWNTQLGVENQWNTPHVWVSNCFAWCKFGLDKKVFMISRIPYSLILKLKSSHTDNVIVSGYHSDNISGNHQLQSSQRDQLSMSVISCSCDTALAAPPFLRWLWLAQWLYLRPCMLYE